MGGFDKIVWDGANVFLALVMYSFSRCEEAVQCTRISHTSEIPMSLLKCYFEAGNSLKSSFREEVLPFKIVIKKRKISEGSATF